MKSDTDSHIRRDQIIGGLVSLIVASFEIFVKVIMDKFGGQPFWWWVLFAAALLVAFFAAFWLIGIAERAMRKREEDSLRKIVEEPIPLKAVGVVNGHWIDAIWDADTKKLIQYSFFELKSSFKDGFYVRGDSYWCESDQESKPKKGAHAGDFHGPGYPYGDTTLSIPFSGHERDRPDQGNISYTFRKEVRPGEGEPDMYFNGHFYGHGLRVTRLVLGKRLKEGEDADKAMNEFLRSPLVQGFQPRTS
jgi:hypothetical protein